jgi:hypothetical protein
MQCFPTLSPNVATAIFNVAKEAFFNWIYVEKGYHLSAYFLSKID